MRYYRCELTFDGEPQDVGIFQGLDDAVPNEASYLSDELFSELLCPVVDADFLYEPLCCWFTETGLGHFVSEMQTLSSYLDEAGWGICAAVIEAAPENAVYLDRDQAVFTVEYLQKGYEMVEIGRIEDTIKLSPSAVY